ncbi:uncharacterized protein VTP21DRAFT_4687 [Calcarisporiella thermophila]|uniref:uncharacterized protein n=1 Tax=Calcarisporiella thermophila TaxID=911321 RepID=UPI003743C789
MLPNLRNKGHRSHIVHSLGRRGLLPDVTWHQKFGFSGNEYFPSRWSLQQNLKGHNGCVNTIHWNDTGELIVSGSDDCHINIWSPVKNPENPLIHSINSGHIINIFSVQFLPHTNSSHIVSCSADGITRFTDLNAYVNDPSWSPLPPFRCHTDITYEVLPDPNDPHIFFDCSDDGTVNMYDLRIRNSCCCEKGCRRHTFIDMRELPSRGQSSDRGRRSQNSPRRGGVDEQESPGGGGEGAGSESPSSPISFLRFVSRYDRGITSLSLRADNPLHLATACADDRVRIYDRRYVKAATPWYTFVPAHIQPHQTHDEQGEHDTTGEPEEDEEARSIGGRARNSASEESEASSNRRHAAQRLGNRQVKRRRTPPPISRRITCLRYDPNGGDDLLVSYSGGELFLIRPFSGNGKQQHSTTFASKSRPKISRNENDTPSLAIAPNEYANNDDTSEKTRDNFESHSVDDDQRIETPPPPQIQSRSGSDLLGSLARNLRWMAMGCEQENEPSFPSEESPTTDRNEHEGELDPRESECETGWHDEVREKDVIRKFKGHRNEKTRIKEANFYGPRSEFILSGSDDGRIFVWRKSTGELVNLLQGDSCVVNCIQPHPFHDPILATSGIDDDIKLWYPIADDPADLSSAPEIIRRNEEFLEHGGRFGSGGSGFGQSERVMIVPADMILQILTALSEGNILLNTSDS